VFVTHDVQESLLLSSNVMVFDSKGSVKAQFEIKSDKSISSRVANIRDFMSEVFVDYMMPIQEAIMNGSIHDLDQRQATSHPSDDQGLDRRSV